MAQYVASCNDRCIKEMYSRLVKDDGTISAIYPFKRLSPSLAMNGQGGGFDPDKQKHSIGTIRQWVCDFKERIKIFVDPTNPDATRKADHFIRALDEQLMICDQSEEMVDNLCAPFPPLRMNDVLK